MKRKKALGKQFTSIRKGGGTGPSRTAKANRKDPRKVWWNPDVMRARKIKKDKHSATQEDSSDQKAKKSK